MSAIDTYLGYIASKRYAKDVRTAIVNAIRECYSNTQNPSLREEAFIAAIEAELENGHLTGLDLGDGDVTTAKIANSAVTTPKIADGAITQAKLDPNIEFVQVDDTLSNEGEAADAKATGDAISALNGSLGRLAKGEISLSEYPTHTGWLDNTSKWVQMSTSSKHCVIPIKSGQTVTIKTPSSRGAYYATLKSYTQPVSNNESADIYKGRTFVQANSTESFVVTKDEKYLYIGINSGNTGDDDYTLESLVISFDKTISEISGFLGEVIGSSTSGVIDISDYPRNAGWLGDNDFNMQVNGYHCPIPVKAGSQVTITPNADGKTYFIFASRYVKPNAHQDPSYAIGGRQYVNSPTAFTVTAPAGTNYLVVALSIGEIDRMPQAITVTTPESLADVINDAVDMAVHTSQMNSITFGTPFTILSNKDEDATELDSGLLTWFNIIQISDMMYYMYYGGIKENEISVGYSQNLLFAYSTDGIHYTRGFPPGITPPYPGTNKYFDHQYTIEPNYVFKCCDSVYPFRLICQEKVSTGTGHHINMYKSTDGINFDTSTKKILRYEYHDTQNAVVCRGNVLKIFFREREEETISGEHYLNRQLGVAFYDLEGNLLSPSKKLPLNYIYNSGATPINDREELIFPTHFNNNPVGGVRDQSYSLSAHLVDKYYLKDIQSNIMSIITADDKFLLIQPGFITINGEQYVGIRTNNFYHDDTMSTDPANRISSYRLVKVTMNMSS